MDKFRRGDRVQTTKGDRFAGPPEKPMTVIKYGKGWKKYPNVICAVWSKHGSWKSTFLEKNLVLVSRQVPEFSSGQGVEFKSPLQLLEERVDALEKHLGFPERGV